MILVIFFASCETKKDATQILSDSINTSGGMLFDKKQISFDFRGKSYISKREGGNYALIRVTEDSVKIVDELTNNGFKRYINNALVTLPDSTQNEVANSVNSVHYFAYLPYGLDNQAINEDLVGIKNIKGKEYYKIKVWFDEEGGGQDFEDTYLYWVNKKTNKIDYLAYEYHVHGGGIRFREAYNRRQVNGIDFVDYYNYKPKEKNIDFNNIDDLFSNNQVKLVSKIELKNIAVNSLKKTYQQTN